MTPAIPDWVVSALLTAALGWLVVLAVCWAAGRARMRRQLRVTTLLALGWLLVGLGVAHFGHLGFTTLPHSGRG